MIRNKILQWIYPAKCPLCGVLLEKGSLVCAECARRTKPIREPLCKKCGRSIENTYAEFCRDCMEYGHLFSCGRSVYPYRGGIRRAVWRFKYKNCRCYAAYFSAAMWTYAGNWLVKWQPDLIIPVPIHRSKRKARGYNQAFLLAAPLGERLGVPVLEHGLLRVRATQPQKGLDRKNRQINMKRAFKIGRDDVKLRKILLVDDIYTTGSTIDAAAAVLLEEGAVEVRFLTLCTGQTAAEAAGEETDD